MSLYIPGTEAYHTHRLHEGVVPGGRKRGDWRAVMPSMYVGPRAVIADAISLTAGPHPCDFGPHGRAEVRQRTVNGETRLGITTRANPPEGLLLSMTSGEVDGYVFAVAETPQDAQLDCIYPLALWVGVGDRWWAIGAHWNPHELGYRLHHRAAAWLRPGEEWRPLPDGARRVIDEMFAPLGARWIAMEKQA